MGNVHSLCHLPLHFPTYFHRLNISGCTACDMTTNSSGGKGANSRHNGRPEIDVLEVGVK